MFKQKLVQILLGAIGSVIAAVVTHYTQVPGDVAGLVALGAGPATTAALGNVVDGLFNA